ncbi:MAG: hypothetical protein WCH57_06245 [Verrucomicrobiota bacterium]
MIRFFLILLLAALGALMLQFYLPPLAFLSGARIILLPLVFFFGALALPFPGMLALAFVCGLMWDALTAQVLEIGMGPTSARVVEIGIGWSILLYAVLGCLMSGFRPLFQRGRWEIHCLLSGLCTSVIVLAEFLMISVRRAAFYNVPFEINPDIWWRIGGPGLVALVLAPGVFFFLKAMAALVGYNPAVSETPEEEI